MVTERPLQRLKNLKVGKLSKMKCKHGNGQFTEFMRAEHIRFVNNGEIEKKGVNEIGNITGYQFHCYDCRMRFNWGSSLTAPKWAQKYFEGL